MLNPCLDYPLGSPAMPSGRGRIDPPQIEKKESPRKQLPICSITKPVSSAHAFRLTHYAISIWEGKDRPSTDKWKKRKSMQAISYTLNHQAYMLNPCLEYPLGSPAMPSGRGRIDPPQIGKKNVQASNCLYAQPPNLYAQPMP